MSQVLSCLRQCSGITTLPILYCLSCSWCTQTITGTINLSPHGESQRSKGLLSEGIAAGYKMELEIETVHRRVPITVGLLITAKIHLRKAFSPKSNNPNASGNLQGGYEDGSHLSVLLIPHIRLTGQRASVL